MLGAVLGAEDGTLRQHFHGSLKSSQSSGGWRGGGSSGDNGKHSSESISDQRDAAAW